MASPTRLRFFPSIAAPAPTTNGNGSKAAPAFVPGFLPLDAYGKTVDVRMSTERAMLASVLCYAAITYRMQKLCEAPLFIADETAEGEPWVQNHPLAALLEQPNQDQEMADLLEETHLSLDLTGKSLWVKQEGRVRSIAPVGRLQHFRGDEFSVHQADGRMYGRFQVNTSQGPRNFTPEEVIFFRYPHPTNRWDALSPTDVVLSWLGIEGQLVTAIKSGLRNSVKPGLHVGFEKNLTDEQRAEYKASLGGAHASALNMGKPFVTEGNLKVEELTLGFEGLQGGDLYRECEAAVCIAFKVRPEILGMMIGLENAPWSHMQTAQRLTYDEAIIPLWRRWERTLTRQLLRPVDSDVSRQIRFDTSKIRALQDDQEQKAKIALLVKGIATRNQRRQLAQLEPMTDDLDFWDAVEGAAAPAPPPPPAVPAAPVLELVKQAPAPVETKADEIRWAIWDAVTSSQAYSWTVTAAAQLDADKAAALRLSDATLKPRKKDDDPSAAPPDPATVEELIRVIAAHMDLESAAAWKRRVAPLTTAGARAAVERMAGELGLSFDLLQPGLLAYVEKEAAWLVTEVSGTTKQAIRDTLSAGLDAGESIPKLRARIESLGTFDRTRAELIARTETVRVSNGAARESLSAYQADSGDRITKRWLTAQDDRVRDAHRELHDQKRGLDEPFSNGLQQPGEPNCRCTLVYAMEPADATEKAAAALVEATKALTELAQRPPEPVHVHVEIPAPKSVTKTVEITNSRGETSRATLTEE